MAPSRRTRSGRNAPSAPTKRIRTKGGCLTCRIRRKKCDESREFSNGCETCARLHIECLGYSTKRPEWLKGARVDDYKRKIKHFLADHSARSSARSPDEAFLELHHLRNSSTPPRQHSESSHTDSDSDSESDVASTADLKLPQLPSSYSIPPLAVMPDLWIPDTTIENSWVPSLDFLPIGFQEESSPATAMYPHYPFTPLDLASTLVPDPMHNEQCISPLQTTLDSEFQVGVSQYQYPTPGSSQATTSIWENVFALLSLAQVGDPEGYEAVAKVFDDGLWYLHNHDSFIDSAETEVSRQLEARKRAQLCLLQSGYNDHMSRAVTSLWMMRVTLSQGHFDSWGNCLDVVVEWIRNRLSSPSVEVSSLDLNDQRVLSHGLWVDLLATATTQRVPLHIDLYRRILRSTDSVVLDCPNKVVLAFVELIALAANPSHLSQARGRLQQLRESLTMPSDDDSEPMSTAQVHTAGINLYLEIVASRGIIEPSVQKAVDAVCEAVHNQTRREFAFWVFLAGCHTRNRWTDCSAMMNELIQTENGDGALRAASDVMKETYNARKHGGIAPDFWVQRMRERNILLA
ncbi:unnamed protein product [Rhizoctonia solani]|uniref:Zn(2)-C6 fungal-type domain-containing protein n=1 Tax=Rhizoctonia solani TaxID=456999 RepID=A0A8H3B0R7_9AGAM|nr:unnamed protein product [Rhizoctonia solani]